MQLTLLSLIYFIAFSHALFITIAIWRQTEKGQPGRILALLVAALAYKLFEGGVTYSDLYRFIPHSLDWLPGVVLIMGPLFYGYIRSVTGEAPLSKGQWLIHLSPAMLLMTINSPELFIAASTKIERISQFNAYEGPLLLPTRIIFLLIILKLHLATYLTYAWKMLARFDKGAQQLRADDSALILHRHKQLCLALIMLESAWVILFILQQTAGIFALDYVGKSWLLFMSAIIGAMGFYGLMQPRLLFSKSERELILNSLNQETIAHSDQAIESNRDGEMPNDSENGQYSNTNLVEISQAKKSKNIKNQKKYHLTPISEAASDEVISLINKTLVDQQLFLDDKLTLSSLAESLQLKPHMVSQVINQAMDTNFYQLINQHRVSYAEKLLARKEAWSIERIAYESGFGNRVTFNNAFKTLKGCSPSVYRKQLLKAG